LSTTRVSTYVQALHLTENCVISTSFNGYQMRTHAELLREIDLRRLLGLPRIQLTAEERARAFGDQQWADKEDYDEFLAKRYLEGLAMSKSDKSRARKYLKGL